jgi:hypothetical protein
MRLLALLAAAAALLAPAALAGSSKNPVRYAWTQLAPVSVSPSGLVAKAIVEQAACPSISLTGASSSSLAMSPLSPPAGIVGFGKILVCTAALPVGTTAASVGGRKLPVPASGTPSSIGVIGDTGCLILPPAHGKAQLQDCNKASKWPFAAIARQVAAAAPGLIVHVGDYIYRQANCATAAVTAKDLKKCEGSPNVNPAGSPNFDNWKLWETDFFKPAKPLLSIAPFVFVRGNHDLCSRAGNGYFLFLDPGVNPPGTCTGTFLPATKQSPHPLDPVGDFTKPYAVTAGSLQLVVVDVAAANDFAAVSVPMYTQRFAAAAALSNGQAWLLLHAPVLGYQNLKGAEEEPDEAAPPSYVSLWKNVTEQVVTFGKLASEYSAIVSGHVHVFQAVDLPGQPPQLIFGNGGTKIAGGLTKDPGPPTYGPLTDPTTGAPLVAGTGTLPAPSYGGTVAAGGYGIVRPSAGGWTATDYSAQGAVLATCPFTATTLTCSFSGS